MGLFLLGAEIQPMENDFQESLPTITVSAAEGQTKNWDRPIRVCGQVTKQFAGRFVLADSMERYLLVQPAPSQGPSAGQMCLTGVVQRSDGYTVRGAVQRGLPFYAVEHSLNDSVVMRPCSDARSCAKLARGKDCASEM